MRIQLVPLSLSLLLLGLPASFAGSAPSRQASMQPAGEAQSDDEAGDEAGDESDEQADDESDDEAEDSRFAETFATNPLERPDTVVSGDPLARLEWSIDDPAFDGDPPGSLAALYDASLPAGLFGFELTEPFDADEAFTAAAAFVIEPEGFAAQPDSFFQISFGLWSSATTGLNRTGSFASFAGDTFELVEFDYFPNVSSFGFGGPFLASSAFGAADLAHPSFPFLGSFANFTSLFNLEAELPLGVPLLAVLEHRPGADALVVQVLRILDAGTALPVVRAVGHAPLDALSLREYTLDTIGLTLWNDGFGGGVPAVVARLRYHALVVVPGVGQRPEELLDAALD